MAVTNLIFMKLKLTRQFFVNNSCAEFHENPTDGIISDVKSQTDV